MTNVRNHSDVIASKTVGTEAFNRGLSLLGRGAPVNIVSGDFQLDVAWLKAQRRWLCVQQPVLSLFLF